MVTLRGHRVPVGIAPRPPSALTTTVVVCTYAERRWDTLMAALSSLRAQRRTPDQQVVVVDHNDAMLARLRAELPADIEVVANDDEQGLAGARNSGVRRATGDVVAFLDDDAAAEPGWLEAMVAHYADPAVVGVGGAARPVWPGGARPRWFPAEFDWVVGCTHRGLPEVVAPVRNPVGASMSMRRSLFDVVGGFDTGMGRIGTVPLGCEETELAVRARRHMAGVSFLHVPEAVVHHVVAPERATVAYFLRRCRAEGYSKAALTGRAGAGAALATERRYSTVTLPCAVLAELGRAVRGQGAGLARAAMILTGLCTTAAGYAMGRLRARTGRAAHAVGRPRSRHTDA